MIRTLALLFMAALAVLGAGPSEGFKDQQKRYPRVRTAYAEKEEGMRELLRAHSLSNEFELCIRVFKQEKELELWARDKSSDSFTLIKTYPVCRTSGGLGPKRKQGDLQIPEGFYHINVFNPASSFYLSMGINYPNASDRILGEQGKLGGDIFIHGDCVTIGCVPITDDQIKELFVFCVEAKEHGQEEIPVSIFPAKLSANQYADLERKYAGDDDKLKLWKDLKTAYDLFERDHRLPSITFLSDGGHEIK